MCDIFNVKGFHNLTEKNVIALTFEHAKYVIEFHNLFITFEEVEYVKEFYSL